MAEKTLCEAFQVTAAKHRDDVALRTLDGSQEITWSEYAQRVERLARGLDALGLRRGDVLMIMMINRPEFHLIDAAAMHLGALPYSGYNTSSPDQVDFLVRDSGARIAVVEDAFRDRVKTEQVFTVSELEQIEAAGEGSGLDFEATWRAVRPDDLLTLIYTSGTTGDPKAVQITHRNTVATNTGFDELIGFPEGGDVVSYLPMAHIAERNCSHYLAMLFGFRVTSCPDARELAAALAQVHPAWFFAVPRIFEKLRAGVLASADAPLRAAIERSLARRRGKDGPEPDEELLAGLRARLGFDRVKALNVGAAPTPPEVIEFFDAIGLPLGELWAMSETAGAGTCNPADRVKIGTVGPPLPGVQVRLAEDGEVEVRGDCVTPGYRNRPDLTAAAFTADGWLRTGDIGVMDDDGYLTLVDRKKELIINAAGKNMSPANIESRLKASSPLIGSAVAIGDRRPYNVALIVLDPDGSAAFARENDVAHAIVADLADEPRVVEAITRAVEEANRHLANVEQIKRFKILHEEWQPGGDELTPTMKLKRKQIAARYATQIDALYAPASN